MGKMAKRLPQGFCECGDPPGCHDMIVIRPVCIDHGVQVLFEGTLGACHACGCRMYARYISQDELDAMIAEYQRQHKDAP